MKEASHQITPKNGFFSEICRASMAIAPSEEIIFVVSFVTAFALLQLPFETIDGNPIPTVIFKDMPAFFHSFLLALNFAFSAAVMTICLRQMYPVIAGYCRGVAIVAMAAALGIAVWLVLPASFGWVASNLCHY